MPYFLFLLLLFSLPTQALELTGHFTQGGLVIGKATPGSEVKIAGQYIPTGQDGTFVYGLSRKAATEVPVVVKQPDGTTKKQTLLITPRTFNVQHIKGVKKKHVTPRSEADWKQIKSDKAAIVKARAAWRDAFDFKQTFTLPASGTITGVFGSRRTYNGEERSWHKGLDIAAPTGTPIYAPIDGVVRLALPMSFFNGNLIILDHGQEVFTLYAHLHKIHVTEGQAVKQGDHIGDIGSTGRSTGPHLHWGMSWRGIALDPALMVGL